MAVFIVRALGLLPDDTGPALFVDVPPSHTHHGYIQRFAKLRITSGCGPIHVRPLDWTTEAK